MPGRYYWKDSADDDWSPQNHSTAMLFKAISEKRGVSKNATITIIQTPGPILSAFDWAEYH
jgi:hypothetical protein